MNYKIILNKEIHETFYKLEPIFSRRIIKKIRELSEDPFSKDIKRVRKETVYRLRVGKYRILFEIEKDKIIILKVGHRKNIYKL